MPHDFHSPRWETPKTPGALRRCYGSWDLKVMLLLILNLLSGNSATFGELGYSGLISDRLWHHRHDQRLWWKHRRHRYLVAQWLSSVSVIIWFVVCVCVCFFVLLLPLHCSFSLLLKCLCVYILIVVRRHCIFQSKQLRPGGHARCCRTFAPSSRTHPGGMRDSWAGYRPLSTHQRVYWSGSLWFHGKWDCG